MTPLLSIVTVSLNAAGTIVDTLASVAGQRGGIELEHICVDGGSSDGTRALIDSMVAHHTHLRRVFEPDRGIYDAMNKGFTACRGEYVLYLNADDFLFAPDTLSQALGGLTRSAPGNPDLIVGDVVMGEPGRYGWWRDRRVPRALARWSGLGLFPIHQGRIVRRTLIEGVGGFDVRSRLAADVIQFYDMERVRPLSIRVVDLPIAFMRAGGAANGSPGAMWLGTREIFAHLKRTYGAARAGAMTMVKTLQSLSEVRFGRCPGSRWFAA